MNHSANIGTTGSGKTFQAIKEAAAAGQRCIYINPKPRKGAAYSDKTRGFYRVFPDELTIIKLRDMLMRGIMVEFVPSNDIKIGNRQIGHIVDEAFRFGNIRVIFDEAAVHSPEGIRWSPAIDVAERGREAKVQGVFICQSPASMSKRILQNCDINRIFRFNLNWAGGYLNSKGYDADALYNELQAAPEYSYILLENGEKRGVRKA